VGFFCLTNVFIIKVTMNKKRFNQLLESKSGDVKPLISEALPPLSNFFFQKYNIYNKKKL
jgi:hypothetical protein